ncbi:ribonuclease P [Candidatus Woesearchaeota archaeon]|nr:ribonuclease P [Candidatus Woesearchaeota archaeon]
MSKKKIIKKDLVEQKKIAKKRIEDLLNQAKDVFSEDAALSNRYVELARKISMKSNVRFTSEQKRLFCKHCYTFLSPGINCRVRVRDKLIVYYCEACKKFSRFGYSRKPSK